MSIRPKIIQMKTFLFSESESYNLLVPHESQYFHGAFGSSRFLNCRHKWTCRRQIGFVLQYFPIFPIASQKGLYRGPVEPKRHFQITNCKAILMRSNQMSRECKIFPSKLENLCFSTRGFVIPKYSIDK